MTFLPLAGNEAEVVLVRRAGVPNPALPALREVIHEVSRTTDLATAGCGIATSPSGRLDHYLLGFGQDPAGEMYVLTSDEQGPRGTTGRVYRLVRPSG